MTCNSEPDWNSVSTSRDARNMARHRWYWVKEGFSPLLVRNAVETEHCGPADLVMDPFCGSGTVPLETSLCKIKSFGVEVNPFLAFVSHAKTLTPRKRAVVSWSGQAKKAIHTCTHSPLIGISTFARTCQNRGLFNQEVLKGFEGAWQVLGNAPASARDTLRLCLLRAALDCANFRRDGKALRYRDALLDRRYGREDLEEAFSLRVCEVLEDIQSTSTPTPIPRIALTDSRLDYSKYCKSFKLCVTSPPYLNSFDYTDVYRPELFLGGFVRSAEELQKLRLRTIRSHVQATWKLPVASNFGPLFEESHGAIKLKRSELWNRRIPEMIQAYFEDMRTVLRRLRTMAREDSVVWLAVSTSAYAGVEIPVDQILAHLGSQVGWYHRETRFLRNIRSSGQQMKRLAASADEPTYALRESLMIFDANPNR